VTTRRGFIGAGAQLALAATCGALVAARNVRAADASIKSTPLARGIWLLDGAGCNVVALQGPQGSLLVDGGHAKQSKALLQAASKDTGNTRVATLINTHWHPAQTGSNETIGRAGGVIIAHEVTRKYLARPVPSADYDGLYGPLKPEGLPTKTTRTTDSLDFAGHHIDYGYLPAAHTNGDLYIHLPEDNLLITGGPVQSAAWPLLDWRNGAWLGGLVKAHEKLAKLAKADTCVIPANGPPLSGTDLTRQHEMFAAFHEKMVVFQNKGYDSGDCIAARPLKDFEPRLGDASEFVRGAFQSLNLAYSPD
jgi:glyoxylase-like metal-dependent hydrolase (beta-lactamase superfamily II)